MMSWWAAASPRGGVVAGGVLVDVGHARLVHGVVMVPLMTNPLLHRPRPAVPVVLQGAAVLAT